MKTKFVLLATVIFSFTAINVFAQGSTPAINDPQTTPSEECGSQAGQAAIDYEKSVDRTEYKKLMKYYLDAAPKSAIVQYAVQIHIVRRDDGTGGVDIADIRDEIEDFVNPYFAGIEVEFIECGPEMYHNSTEYFVLGNGSEDADVAGDAMSATYNVDDVINIYYVNTPGGGCGWARFPWNLPVDYIVIKNSCANNQSTTVHELGHYFGLYHTHETFDGTAPESVTRVDTDGCWDCETDGDKLCDTPADPNLSSTANDWPSCSYTGTGTDACNGQAYVPDINNIMSYADKECRTIFTGGQNARMEVFRDGDRSYLTIDCCAGPEAICQNITVDLDATGNASITPSSVDNGSTWDCGFALWSVTPSSFDCNDVGANIVTLTVIDDLGAESTCQSTVTIADDTDPVITTGASNMLVSCDGNGNSTEFANWLNNNGGAQATDACGGSWSNNSAGLSDGCGATGSETVTFTYTDPSLNSASTMATFTIEDNTDPSLTCPANIHLPECVETAQWTVIASDICSNVTVVSNPPSGSVFPKGTTTTVTVTATDECGNDSECTFEVTRDPDLMVGIDPLATSPLNTCAAGTNANIVLGYGGGPTCTTLNAVGSGGHAPYTYAWAAPVGLPVGSFDNANTASPIFCADFQTDPCATYTFEVTVTDIHGCQETSEVDISVVNPLCSDGDKPKVFVCHRPPGFPDNEQTICTSSNAASTHLDSNTHQDCLGSCDDICVTYGLSGQGLAGDLGSNGGQDANILTVYPNPSSYQTVINFSIGSDTEVRLTIVDATGRVVATLYEGQVEMNKPYAFEWDAGYLPSGMYIAQLIGGEGVNARSTILLLR